MAKIAQIMWLLCESCMRVWRSVWIQHVVSKMVQTIPPASKKMSNECDSPRDTQRQPSCYQSNAL